MATSTRKKNNTPKGAVDTPIENFIKGDYIIDPWHYIWRVEKDVADTMMEDGKIVVHVVRVDVAKGGQPRMIDELTYKLDYEPDATELKYTERQIIKLLVGDLTR